MRPPCGRWRVGVSVHAGAGGTVAQERQVLKLTDIFPAGICSSPGIGSPNGIAGVSLGGVSPGFRNAIIFRAFVGYHLETCTSSPGSCPEATRALLLKCKVKYWILSRSHKGHFELAPTELLSYVPNIVTSSTDCLLTRPNLCILWLGLDWEHCYKTKAHSPLWSCSMQ